MTNIYAGKSAPTWRNSFDCVDGFEGQVQVICMTNIYAGKSVETNSNFYSSMARLQLGATLDFPKK